VTTEKEAAILDATLNLIAERGFHDTPMSLIAKEADVSAGIIYHYFENKDALIRALYRRVKIRFVRALSAGVSEDMPLREQFRQMMINALRFFLREPKSALFIQQFTTSPYYDPDLEAEFHQYYAALLARLERAQRDQVIKDLPDQVFYTFSIEVASALAQKHAAGIITLSDDLIEQVADMCWEALRR
jgi:AcrR family transcriptional regulator